MQVFVITFIKNEMGISLTCLKKVRVVVVGECSVGQEGVCFGFLFLHFLSGVMQAV